MKEIRPDYYKSNGIETIDVIEAFDLNFCLIIVVTIDKVRTYAYRYFRKPTRPSLPLRKAPHLSPSLSLARRERM